MMNLLDAIFTPDWHQRLVIHRRTGAFEIDGVWRETYEDSMIDCATHPASVADVQMLREGERELPGIKVYSVQPIGYGDLVEWRGDTYRVTALADYSEYGFYDATAVRLLQTTKTGGSAFEPT